MKSCFDGKPARQVERDGATCSFWTPAEGVLVSRAIGYLHHEFAQTLLGMLVPMLYGGPPIEQFHDWNGIQGFDIRCQADLTAWHVMHRSKVERLEILCQSNLVRMGVRVANLALRGLIHVHDDPVVFAEMECKLLSARQAAAFRSVRNLAGRGRPL
jgi:hypothetical protein